MESVKDCSRNVLCTLANLKLTAIVLLCFCDVTCVASEESDLSKTNFFQLRNIFSFIKVVLGIQDEVAEDLALEGSPETATELVDEREGHGANEEDRIKMTLSVPTEEPDVKLRSTFAVHEPGGNSGVHESGGNLDGLEKRGKNVTGEEQKQEQNQGVNSSADVEGEETPHSELGEKLDEDIHSITAEYWEKGTKHDEAEEWDDKEKDDLVSLEKDLENIESKKVIIPMNASSEESPILVELDEILNHEHLYKFHRFPSPIWFSYVPLRDPVGHGRPPQVEIQNNVEERETLESETNFSRNDGTESNQEALSLPEVDGPSGEQALCESQPCNSTATNNGVPGEMTTTRIPEGDGKDLKLEISSTESEHQSSTVSISASQQHLPNLVKTTTKSTFLRITTIPSISSSSSTSPESVFPTIRRCCPLGHLFENDDCIRKSKFLFVNGDVISQILPKSEIRKVICNASSILTHTTVQGDIDSVFFVGRGSKVLLKAEESLLQVPSDEYCLDGTDGAVSFTAYYCALPTILFHLACGLNSRSPCARKCCPHGEVLKENECVNLREENRASRLGRSLWQHIELVPIPGLPVCREPLPGPHLFTLKEDGALQVSKHMYSFQNYCIEYVLDRTSDKLEQEAFTCEENSPALMAKNFFIIIGLLVSCVFLAATLFFHAAIPELRNLQDLTLMSYVASLLMADATLLSTKIYAQHIIRAACIAIAFLMQLSFLASFFWLNVMCFDIWCYVGKTIQMVPMTTNMRDTEEDQTRYGRYALYAWGTPVIIVVITVAFTLLPPEVTTAITPTFHQGICWFQGDKVKLVFFYAPCGILFFSNLVLILHTVVRLCQSGDTIRSLLTRTQSTPEIQYYNRAHLKEFWYRFSFFSITAMCWAAEVLSWWLGTPKEVWNITDILNTLQGLFVFVVFVAHKQKRVLVSKYCDRKQVELVIWWNSENPARSCFCKHDHSRMESKDRIQTTVNSISKGIRSSMPTCTPKMPTVPLSAVLSKTGKLVLSPDVLTKKRSSSLSNLTDSLKDVKSTGKKAEEDSITCQSMKKTFSLDFDIDVEGDLFYANS